MEKADGVLVREGEKNKHKNRGLNCIYGNLLLFLKPIQNLRCQASNYDPNKSLNEIRV